VKNNFKNNLAVLRAANNLTLEDLENKTEISHKTLQRYEAGTTEPTVSNLIKIASAFQIGLDYLCVEKLTIKIEVNNQ
jgi:transcriptional regulator with XRE-family HTH domain